jgi:CheY-like chemotaxis protein
MHPTTGPALGGSDDLQRLLSVAAQIRAQLSSSGRAEGALVGVRVLVVDDNLDHLEIMNSVLTYAGATVSLARTAQEAFDSFQADPPDVVVADLAMPYATGYKLIRGIRSTHKGRAVPAVAVTAHHAEEHREKALRAGFDEWLAKPVTDMIVPVVVRLARRG